MAKLFWLQPDNTIVEFPLKAEQSLIGRSSRCDVCIKHPGISAEHAVIRQVSGAATVEDLGSTNGTRVNGKKISQMHTLRHGDQIGVGRERLMYFAELDSAATFMQPESIEPFAIPAPVRERVSTASDQGQSSTVLSTPERSVVTATGPARTEAPTVMWPSRENEPVLDVSLLAALPKGAALAASGIVTARAAAPQAQPGGSISLRAERPETSASVPTAQAETNVGATVNATAVNPPPTTPRVSTPRTLVGSVSVLSGPAAGTRYPLTQTSVSLGKEGKQVVEFVRAAAGRWQIRQREGITPAYINGDALEGLRDLAAGDVIELTGVRLRFEITLSQT